MIYQVFAVYDVKVGAFVQPFFMRSRGEAIRSFETAVRDEKTPLYSHAEDYALWFLCEFDDTRGVFFNETPVSVIGASEFSTE